MQLPSILMLLLLGFIGGSVLNLVNPDTLLGDLLFPVLSLSVALILFEGGLSLRVRELREIGGALGKLLTVGVVVTWVLATAGAYWILDFPGVTSLLLGAILVVTGPTVIGPMLRHIRPIGRVTPIAKWEGIVIDPIGATLAILVFEAESSVRSADFATATMHALGGLLRTTLLGTLIGAVAAGLIVLLIKRYWIPDYLQSPMTLMMVVAGFAASNLLQAESGLLTVTVMGIVLANQTFVSMKPIMEFKESLSVLLISSVFILLSARLDPSELTALGWRGPAYLAFLMLVVRPASVMISSIGSELTWNERIFLSWLAPRGIVAAAVASVFALRMGDAGAGLVPAMFLVIVGTVLTYGLTSPWLARKLKLATPNPQGLLIVGAHPFARSLALTLQDNGFSVQLVDKNWWNVYEARFMGLTAHQADILSENILDELNLGGLGRFLALTPNDEVNSLAVAHLQEFFGRVNVFRLAPTVDPNAKKPSPHLQLGRILFGKNVTYNELKRRMEEGATIKAIKLTNEYTYEDYQQQYGARALTLFVITSPDRLMINIVGTTTKPKAGQTIISLLEPEPSRSQNTPESFTGERLKETGE